MLQTIQRELEEMRQHAEEEEATLRSERDAFEEERECLKDNLSGTECPRCGGNTGASNGRSLSKGDQDL